MRTPVVAELKKIDVVTMSGRGVYLGVSHGSHSQDSRVSVLPNLWRSWVFLPTSFNAERPNSAW